MALVSMYFHSVLSFLDYASITTFLCSTTHISCQATSYPMWPIRLIFSRFIESLSSGLVMALPTLSFEFRQNSEITKQGEICTVLLLFVNVEVMECSHLLPESFIPSSAYFYSPFHVHLDLFVQDLSAPTLPQQWAIRPHIQQGINPSSYTDISPF